MTTKSNFLSDKILVVEDEPILRHNLTNLLEMEGFQVYEATNGLEAKQLIKTKRISLVLSDWMMPIMDGLELLQFVKTSTEYNHIPFIFLTAKSNIEDKLIALNLMADDFISKPFFSQELILKCRNNIESRKNLIKAKLKPEESDGLVSRDTLFLNQIKEFIEENIANEALSLADFTRKFPLSASAIQKNIKRITGNSLFQLILDARLIKAKELITNNVGPISEIIFKCGFKHHNYFAKKFKEKFGMLPNQVRKQNL